MRPSLRFLMLAVVGWAGIRSVSVGSMPGAELFAIERSEAKVPAIQPTQFPPIEAVAPAYAEAAPPSGWPGPAPWPQQVQPVMIPVYYQPTPVSVPLQQASYTPVLPTPRPHFYPSEPVLDDYPLSRIAATSMPSTRPATFVPPQIPPVAPSPRAFDRVQLTAWAMLRGEQGMAVGPSSLANGGNLGGSQAGARLSYNFTRQVAATLRTRSNVGTNDGEVAAGVRIQPLQSFPVWFTLERRQSLAAAGGPGAFALFAEGGVYQRPLPWQFSLDAYLQGGVVGFSRPASFIDGGVSATRPIYGQFSGGFGVWGGAQTGVYRVDAGPRISMPLRRNMRVHLDWRQRLAGNAQPGSGPAVTLAGDF